MRTLIALLSGTFLYLQFGLWISPGGLSELNELQRQVDAQKQKNAGLLQRNQKLAAEVIDLKQGLDAVEELAHNELGMIRIGETYYQIVNPPR